MRQKAESKSPAEDSELGLEIQKQILKKHINYSQSQL